MIQKCKRQPVQKTTVPNLVMYVYILFSLLNGRETPCSKFVTNWNIKTNKTPVLRYFAQFNVEK